MKLSISPKVKDRLGQRFGRLLVYNYIRVENTKARNALWLCKCDCGNFTEVRSSHLVSGSVQSCGCLAAENSRKRIKASHNRGKHLYFLKCAGYTKIGRSDDPKRRWYDIQADNPLPVSLVLILENEGDKEKEMHEKFKEYHHTGEWYKLPDGCEIVDLT